MTQQERIRIGELWMGLAQMYGKEIPRPALSIMLNAVADLDAVKIEKALNDWAMTSKLSRHPLPADIREIIQPTMDPSHEAQECVSLIFESIRQFGWADPLGAKEHMGELAWGIVVSHGGWTNLCQNLGTEISESTFRAQARDLAIARITSGRRGLDRITIAHSAGKPEIAQSEGFRSVECNSFVASLKGPLSAS
jgi:hypothetical protein